MSTPLLATGRIVTPYTVNGLVHVNHSYVRNPQLVGSVWQINTRATDSNDLPWSTAAGQLAAVIALIYAAGTVMGTQLFQTLVSGVWITQATMLSTPTFIVGNNKELTQLTVVFRDTLFRKVKVQLMEQVVSAPSHSISPTGGPDELDAFISHYMPSPPSASDPYHWLVGRGNTYLATSPFVGLNVWLNQKLARARGV